MVNANALDEEQNSLVHGPNSGSNVPSNQDKPVDEGVTNLKCMSQEHKDALDKVSNHLTNQWDINQVLPALLAKNVISFRDERRRSAKETSDDKVEAFIEIVKTKGDDAFNSLLSVQHDRQQGNIA